MKFSPSIYIQTAVILSSICVLLSFVLSGTELGIGVLVSSVLLSLNLWDDLDYRTDHLYDQKNVRIFLTFISAIKFAFLMTSLLG